MKTIWSTVYAYLLLLLVLALFGFACVNAKPLPMKLGLAGMGLVFLGVFISASWPDRPRAVKLAKVLNLCTGALFGVAMLLVLRHYLNTVSMT